jgi:hypothetical protein
MKKLIKKEVKYFAIINEEELIEIEHEISDDDNCDCKLFFKRKGEECSIEIKHDVRFWMGDTVKAIETKESEKQKNRDVNIRLATRYEKIFIAKTIYLYTEQWNIIKKHIAK